MERAYGHLCVASSHGDCLLRSLGLLPGLLVDLHAVLRPAFLVHCHSEEPRPHEHETCARGMLSAAEGAFLRGGAYPWKGCMGL